MRSGIDGGPVRQQLTGRHRVSIDFDCAGGCLDPPVIGGAEYGDGHEVATFSRPSRRLISNSLSSRSAVIVDRTSWGMAFGLVPRKSLVAGGPHCARPEAVNGAQPGSNVESNMSPSAKCSTMKPSGSRQ